MTNVQKVVINARLNNGYKLLGMAQSLARGQVAIITKGRHTMAINQDGYDEHFIGRVYQLMLDGLERLNNDLSEI